MGLADTFGGKICAALDRQHPRDLFDVKNLLENEGITSDVKDSFIFYLISHAKQDENILVFSNSHGGGNGDLYIDNNTQSTEKTLSI